MIGFARAHAESLHIAADTGGVRSSNIKRISAIAALQDEHQARTGALSDEIRALRDKIEDIKRQMDEAVQVSSCMPELLQRLPLCRVSCFTAVGAAAQRVLHISAAPCVYHH